VVDKLAKDIARALAAPDLREWIVKPRRVLSKPLGSNLNKGELPN
jgi:hypothetical protein